MKPEIPMFNAQSKPKSQSSKFGHWSLVIGHSSKGFSIIEAVVAVSVFAFAMTSIIGVYLSLQRLNQASMSLNALQQNARFISEDISKITRNGEIAYADYPGASPAQPDDATLRLIDKEGTTVRIYRDTNPASPTFETLFIEKVGFGAPSPFSGTEVKVKDFRVYITPAVDPFLAAGVHQPTATIYLEVEANIYPRDKTRARFQVTLTTRQYNQ